MQVTVSKRAVKGVLALFGLIAVAIWYRLMVIDEATLKTTEFCEKVKRGDDIASILKKAGDSENDVRFSAIFEQRVGQPTWPRHVIWNGPHYKRVYCSLEPGPTGKVLAIHIGPIDEVTPGFFEDWIFE